VPAVEASGYRIDHSEGGLYLWATRGVDCWESVAEFAARGILVTPGEFYGSSQHVRIALTATDADIASAAARLGQSSK